MSDVTTGAGADTAKTDAPKGIALRVLSDHGDYKCGSLITLPKGEAAEAVAAGWADDDGKAVAYAKRIEDRARLIAEASAEA